MKVIDAWMQHPTELMVKQEYNRSIMRWTRMGDNVKDVTVEGTLKAMGDVVGLCSAWYGPMGGLVTNDEVHEACAKSGGRLIGVGSVDIRKPSEAVAEVRRCINSLGFKGIRVLAWLWELPLTHRYYYPIFAACEELGVPICIQVGHTGPLKPSETGRPIPYVDQIALDFPNLVIVGGHIGYPWTQEMIAVCTKHENVYIDTSAYVATRYPEELLSYMVSKAGRKKVLFGSNYPMLLPKACLKGLDRLIADRTKSPADAEEVKRLFLHANAERVFKLGGSTTSRL